MAAELVLEPEYDEDEAPTRPINKQPALTESENFALRKLVRNWVASSPEDRRLIQAVAVRVRAGFEGV